MIARSPATLMHSLAVAPPERVVVGAGAYVCAVAQSFDATPISLAMLERGLKLSEAGALPLVFRSLEQLIIVPEVGHSAADILSTWEAAWRWIVRLSAAGEDHEVVFFVLVPPQGRAAMERSLAVGLGLAVEELASHGLAVREAGVPLAQLIAKMQSAVPCDRVRVLNRRKADLRRRALGKLSSAVLSEMNDSAVTAAAKGVTDALKGSEYDLDLFCRPPSHINGNRLRGLLKRLVTEEVTPEVMQEARAVLADVLACSRTTAPS